MSKQKKDTQPATVALGSDNTSTPQRNNLIGKHISLNQKKETYFGVGGIWLNGDNYTAEVPDGLSDEEYRVISASIADGTLVVGEAFIPPIDKFNSVREEYWQAVKAYGIDNKDVRQKFITLVRRNQDRGWTAYEIAEYCLQKEANYKKRAKEMLLFKQVIDNHSGPTSLYDISINDVPDDAGSTTKQATPSRKTSPANNKSDMPQLTEESKKALDSILGL